MLKRVVWIGLFLGSVVPYAASPNATQDTQPVLIQTAPQPVQSPPLSTVSTPHQDLINQIQAVQTQLSVERDKGEQIKGWFKWSLNNIIKLIYKKASSILDKPNPTDAELQEGLNELTRTLTLWKKLNNNA